MNRFQVDFQVEFPPPPTAEDRIRDAVTITLNREHAHENTSLTILLTDENSIRGLNHQFMGEDKATDVLSFPAGMPTPGAEHYLGDIAISVPTAQRQAEIAGYPVVVELQLLAVHATLHLLGYDHLGVEEKQTMWGKQLQVLLDLGIEHVSPP